ncbi:MAG: hypothetical protein R2809_09430 [Flavobacteriales bacterium]
MKNSKLGLIVVVAILFLGGLIFFFIQGSKNYSWWESYDPYKKEPYDLYILYNLLSETNDISKFEDITDSTNVAIAPAIEKKENYYVFVGNTFYAEKKDIDSLFHFISNGNKAFLSVNEIDAELVRYIYNYLAFDSISNKNLDHLHFEEIIEEEEEYDWEEVDDYSDDDEYSDYIDYDEYDEYGNYIGQSESYILSLYETEINVSLLENPSKKYKLSYLYEFDTIPHYWSAFDTDFFDRFADFNVKKLGKFATSIESDKYTNYVEIPMGEGFLYLHTTPLIFTNIQLLEEERMRFAEAHFQSISNGNLYWAEENRRYIFEEGAHEKYKSKAGESSLEFILSEPSLRKAYYLLLLTVILYLFFGAKRKQRIIPIQSSPKNTSIEYAGVVSQLFFEQSDHYKLIVLKMDLFKSHILEKYGLRVPANKSEWEKFSKVAAAKTGIHIQAYNDIFQAFITAEVNHFANAYDMVQFHKLLEIYYQQSKK